MSQDSSARSSETLSNFTWLLDTWAAGMAAAIESMGSSAPTVETAAAAEPEKEADAANEGDATETVNTAVTDPTTLWWAQAFNIHSSHCVWVGMTEPVRRRIGTDALIAAGLENPDEADILSTFQELLAQSMTGLAGKLTARGGREATCHSGNLVPEVQGEVMRGQVIFRTGEAAMEVTFAASLEFIDQLMRAGFYRETGWIARNQRSGDRRGRGARASDRRPAEKPVSPKVDRDGLPFDSLLDMDIPVSMSFGSAKLRLDEVLQMRQGSVMVLGSAIDDMVDLQVNGRVVARGEVVVVRGQYGLRIRELASEAERLGYIDATQIDPRQRPEIEPSPDANVN
jgi:flagellar motor switch protein FliN